MIETRSVTPSTRNFVKPLVDFGIEFLEGSAEHAAQCDSRSCRLVRYSDDSSVLRFDFNEDPTNQYVDPLVHVVRWSLGGNHCGDFSRGQFYGQVSVDVIKY